MEIERKWLLGEMPNPDFLPVMGMATVYQGYISRNDPEVRIRCNINASGICRAERTLTIKRGSGLSREEYEVKLTQEQFDQLHPAVVEGDELTKNPFVIYQLKNGLLLEVSPVSRNSVLLIMAEVEFPDEATAKAFVPTEFKQYLAAEVTGDKRWSMGSLSKNQDWTGLLREVYK